MDFVLLILGITCCIVGVIGSVLPVLPGQSISWLGLLLLYCTTKIPFNYWVLVSTFLIMITISILAYIIPAQGTKKFGGTKYGMYGTTIGLVAGLFFPPFGFVIGPFLGALGGELIANPKAINKAFWSATGSFLGFLTSTLIKLVFCSSVLGLFIFIYFTN